PPSSATPGVQRTTSLQALLQIKTIQFHHFGPGFGEVLYKLLLAVLGCVVFRYRTQFGVGTEDQVHRSGSPFQGTSLTVTTFVDAFFSGSAAPQSGHVYQVHEEVVAQYAWLLSEHAVVNALVVGIQYTHTAHQRCHFRNSQLQEGSAFNQSFGR